LFLYAYVIAFQKMYTFFYSIKKMHTLTINSGSTKRNRLVRRKLILSAIAPINKKEKIEKMQINKKLYTTLIITILTLSTIIAAIPMASAAPTVVTVQNYNPITGGLTANDGTTTVRSILQLDGTGANPFSPITVYWDSTVAANILNSTTAATSGGAWSVQVKIPSAINGLHNIIVRDDIGGTGFTAITVNPSISRGSTSRALPGDSITLTGHGFAATNTVTFTLTAPNGTIVAFPPTATANGTGSFTLTTQIPTTLTPIDYSATAWTITGTQGTLAPTTTVTIDYYVVINPTSAPLGITVAITGRIPANTAVTVTFGTATAFTVTSGADGRFTGSYNTFGVPLVPGSTYTVVATWGPVGATVSRTASPGFTVNVAVPAIALTIGGVAATQAQAGTVVTITATSFSNNANVTLRFGTTDVNSTATDSRFGPTGATGGFTAEFTVPALAPSAYTVTLQDRFGATATATFTILAAPATTVALRGTSYYQGDALSFNIVTTEASLGTITVTIRDPSGVTWWTTAAWTLPTTPVKRVMYQDQLITGNPITLPADAPLGSWNWTVTYTPVSTATLTKATALFTVVASSMQTVIDRLDEIEDVITTTEGDIIAVVNTKSGQITTTLDALGAQIQGIEDMSIIIATDVGEIKVAIADLDLGTMGVDITAIKGDVATIKTNLGTVTTNVATLDAKVVALSGDVATVQTTLGTLEGTVTAIDGKVATINTSVGTIKADVSDVKAKPDVDMTPVWIAVVLSLIAAIAAIFAVVTIRQKIAG